MGFHFLRCGLNEGDAVRYGLPENPEKPGTYQWEALDDVQAGALIQHSVAQWIDFDALERVEEQEETISQRFASEIPQLAKVLGLVPQSLAELGDEDTLVGERMARS